MSSLVNVYIQQGRIKSIGVAIVTTVMLLVSLTTAVFSQQTPTPTPVPASQVRPLVKPIATPSPVVSPPAPAPPTDMPNLNDNPPDLPNIPPAPDTPVTNYSDAPRPLPPPERVGVDLTAQTPLSLDDAIRLALENNNDIEIAKSDVKSAEFDLSIARGAYDPTIVSEGFFKRSTTPTASSLSGADGSLTETSFNANVGVNGEVPFQGGSFTSNFSANRATTNNSFTSLNPQYPSSFRFEYTQPLFRGRRFDNTRRQIEISKKNLSLTDSQFRQRTIEIIAQVESAYWDLVYAQRNLQVQLDGVQLANAQVASNERQVEQGVLAPSDVIAARSQVATFEQNVFQAQQAITQSENRLKALILADRTSPMFGNPIVPITPVRLAAPTADLNDSLITALANRPEIRQLETNAEINEIDKRYFRDQTKPQIDLVGSYSTAGLAGAALDTGGSNPLTAGLGPLIDRLNVLSTIQNLPPIVLPPTTGGGIPPNLVGGYGQSLSNLFAQRYPTYQIGVRISIPFRNTVAKGNLGKALVQETRIQSQRDKAELAIETEVRDSLQALRSQESRLRAATDARVAAEQLYDSEQRKFQTGTSTVFLVLQRQTDLINARGREVQVQTDLNKAITEFQRSIGTTLESANVTFNKGGPSKIGPDRTQLTTIFGNPIRRSKSPGSLSPD